MSGATAERIGFLGLGHHGLADGRQRRPRGLPADASGRTPPARPSAGPPSTARRALATPAEVAARERHRRQHGRRRRAGRLGAARRGRRRSRRPTRGCCAWTARRSPRAHTRRIGAALRRARRAHARRARHRLLAARRGRHADDHGRRRGRGLRPRAAAARGDGRADRARRRARPGRDAQAHQQRARRRQRGRRSPRRCCSRGATGVDLDAFVRGRLGRLGRLGPAAAEVARRCASTTTRRCSRPRTCSRTCACAWRRPRPPACRSPPPRTRATCSTATMGRGHGEEDYAAHDRGRRGARRTAAVRRAC